MNVMLVNPWLTMNENLRSYPIEPLGLLYIATYAHKRIKDQAYNINIKIFDAQLEGPTSTVVVGRGFRSGIDDNTFKDWLRIYEPEVVGIANNFTPHTNDILEISRLVKEVFPKTKVILGGVNATLAHHELIKNPYVDIIVRNEGEESFFLVLQSIYGKIAYYNILGTTAKDPNGNIFVNPDREFIKNLDDIPIPDRTLINYKRYLSNDKLYFTTKNFPVGTIISSRGCGFNCIFCSTKTMWSQKWRPRSPQNVVEEIEYLVNGWGIREIAFQDDQFIYDNRRIIELCKLIRKRGLSITFIVPSGISPSLLNKETIDKMVVSGFYRIALSIDSGTEKSRKIINKPINLKEMRNLVKSLNSLGIWTYATFVIGFPEETKEDIQRAIDYAYSLRVDFLRFYIAQPYLGSRLYDIYLEKGYFKNKPDEIRDYSSIYNSFHGTSFVSEKELMDSRDKAENSYLFLKLKYMLDLRYIFREFFPKLNSPEKFKYFLRLVAQLWHLDRSRGFTFKS